jgi:hypothetical protein
MEDLFRFGRTNVYLLRRRMQSNHRKRLHENAMVSALIDPDIKGWNAVGDLYGGQKKKIKLCL